MSTVLANPAKMIARDAPRIIHNDRELETYTEALFELTALENPSPSELEAIELLTLLIQATKRVAPQSPPLTQLRLYASSLKARTSRSAI
jgi:hypothetical protein